VTTCVFQHVHANNRALEPCGNNAILRGEPRRDRPSGTKRIAAHVEYDRVGMLEIFEH
jgi:hypothetical protein